MKNFSLILLSILVVSCVKFPVDTYKKVLDVPADFDWKTIEKKTLTITQLSSVLNETGDTVASFLPPGNYNLTVGKDVVLTVVKENTSAQTKAAGIEYKTKVYFPAKDKYATMMFEDLFPYKGDMDMNDAVFGLNIEFYLNAQAMVVGIKINIQPRGVGSSYENIGLAANLSSTIPLDIVDNITYSSTPSLSPFFNVTNNNGSYSPELNVINSEVIPLTGDYRSHFNNITDLFINVLNSESKTGTQNFSALIEISPTKIFPFTNLTFIDIAQPGKINLDIFAVFGDRGREVHFKGQKPTDLFNYQFFLYTIPKTDFSTIDNWVWVIISDKSIRHAQEFVKIYNAYPNFKVWAEGAGSIGSRWYTPSVIDSLYTKANFSYIN